MHYSLAMNAYMLHKWQWFSSQKQLTQLKVLTRLCCKHFPLAFQYSLNDVFIINVILSVRSNNLVNTMDNITKADRRGGVLHTLKHFNVDILWKLEEILLTLYESSCQNSIILLLRSMDGTIIARKRYYIKRRQPGQ